ncbi:hypothetical protein F7725_016802 [Dissostichus mawsoni]|uniref:non-specific serine/threonine protein kinase n=1 Tax=Dissostichus mawsoni TaxID=36200 RepID=A0A7J5Z4S0_DISMA|nr:hypothetical protein F7725_016802 [Dissostichus mawsoni]
MLYFSHLMYVIKKLNLTTSSKRERRSAEQEAQLLSQLRHPNIVTYRESWEGDDCQLYIAMGFCEGGDLYHRLKQQKGELLPERQVVEWFVQIAMALQYLHERNILHRDLKTQNIFLTKTNIIKVGDLGIARVLENQNDMASTLIGTPYYMSPELFSNKPYNHKSDVWALGCCVYEMSTLKHAFNAKDMNSLVYRIVEGKLPQMPSRYDPQLGDLIKSMLCKRPEDRPDKEEKSQHKVWNGVTDHSPVQKPLSPKPPSPDALIASMATISNINIDVQRQEAEDVTKRQVQGPPSDVDNKDDTMELLKEADLQSPKLEAEREEALSTPERRSAHKTNKENIEVNMDDKGDTITLLKGAPTKHNTPYIQSKVAAPRPLPPLPVESTAVERTKRSRRSTEGKKSSAAATSTSVSSRRRVLTAATDVSAVRRASYDVTSTKEEHHNSPYTRSVSASFTEINCKDKLSEQRSDEDECSSSTSSTERLEGDCREK